MSPGRTPPSRQSEQRAPEEAKHDGRIGGPMTAEINQLFEEGITRSQELTDAADAAMNAVDGMAQEAEQLAQRVQQEAHEACQHMRELATRLEQQEGELETARAQAEGALEGLAAKAGELTAEAGHLLERVKKG